VHTTDDKANGLVLNHDYDWGGIVYVAWCSGSTRHVSSCKGSDLVAGRFTHLTGPEPPINVITRVVALAVEGYLRTKLEAFTDNFFIERGKL
jgi:hypothetical protein